VAGKRQFPARAERAGSPGQASPPALPALASRCDRDARTDNGG